MDLQEFLARVPTFTLYLVRVSAWIGTVPFFGSRGDSLVPRVAVAVFASLAMYLPEHPKLDLGDSVTGLVVVAIREALVGVLLGFALHSFVLMMRVAGEVIGQEMGFSFAQVVDPASGQTSPVMAQLLESLVMMLFFALDGHLAVFRVLHGTFTALPVGGCLDLERAIQGLMALSWQGFHLAVTVAFPIVGAVLVTTVTLLLLSRALPQFNLMDLGFSLRILLALVVLGWLLGELAPRIAGEMGRFFVAAGKVVGS